MLLVADSGSSKADWVYYASDAATYEVNSIGVNPNLHSESQIREAFRDVCPQAVDPADVCWIYFYGSGVWDGVRANRIVNSLRLYYPNAEIEIYHDLLGAARAMCGTDPGVACILGTGSNSCLYDGSEVIDNVTNLGWLVGDEGSGVDLGKRLVRAYSYRELTGGLRAEFEDETGHNKLSIAEGLYSGASPNRFLASFSPFIHNHRDEPVIHNLVLDSFGEFLRKHVLKYDGARELPIHFVGSVAYHYSALLAEACKAEGLHMGRVQKKPIGPLVEFHRLERHLPA